MGIFDSMGIEGAADDPFAIPNGVYRGTLTKSYVEPSKNNPQKVGWNLLWVLPEKKNRKVPEWKWMPPSGDESDDADTARSFVKQRILSLGHTVDEIADYDPLSDVGKDYMLTFLNNRINKVEPPKEDGDDAGFQL